MVTYERVTRSKPNVVVTQVNCLKQKPKDQVTGNKKASNTADKDQSIEESPSKQTNSNGHHTQGKKKQNCWQSHQKKGADEEDN